MLKSNVMSGLWLVILVVCLELSVDVVLGRLNYEGPRVVKKDERKEAVSTEFGSISTVDVDGGIRSGDYHLQFINLEPNSLFLPVLLHVDMVFYVRSGSGTLSWTEGEDTNEVSLQRGDLYRLKSDTLFYIKSSVDCLETPRLKIVAIFTNPDEEQSQGLSVGPYSSINDLVRSFDSPVLQATFQVPEEVIAELTNAEDTPLIIHAGQQSERKPWEETWFVNAMFGIERFSKQAADNKKKDKKKKKYTKTFNFFEEEPDFQNCNGWSKVVNKHDLYALRGSQIGAQMVNLTKGSLMGPHWNPSATEVSVVLEGEGMVQIVCPSQLTNKDCKTTRVRVEEGDVFIVPKYHPVAQTSFNNGSLVYLGFSTTSNKKNQPQFLAGKGSFLQALEKSILGAAFNVSNTTISQLQLTQNKSILLDCTSCAEEQEIVSEEETGRGRREEEKEAGVGESEARHQEEERQKEEHKRREEERERREGEGRGGEEETGEERERQERLEEGRGRRKEEFEEGRERRERREDEQGRGEEEFEEGQGRQERREEEHGRGEEEMGGRGEEERAGRQGEEEEIGRRWRDIKLNNNKMASKGKRKWTT